LTHQLTISFGGEHQARITETRQMTWPRYCALFLPQAPEAIDKASKGWSIPASFNPSYRDSTNLVARYALTFDYDNIKRSDVSVIEKAFADLEYLIYTTASHTPAAPRLRVLLPTDRPMRPDEFCAVSRKVAARAGIELASRESHVPAQMMYLPTRKPGGPFKAKRHAGQWLDVDGVLAEYANWEDRNEWPRRADGDSTHTATTGTPPAEKPGIVGDFCRAFDIYAAIERFELPYERVR
jgi:hypothetical protein